ncbi:hypothetical protein ACPB8Q_07140 [Methanocaldococcus indicus]|uniref:hypothetical protein n=1 Tax=Methanocaldococcus indicus TaxID=213231 RepID=UPI003C6D4B42
MLGVATKLSQININELIELNRFISKNFSYHVIDAEINILTDEEILDNLKNAVLTVQSKRKDVFEILDIYSSYDFDVCIVLGNKYYLSDEERKLSKFRILDVIEKCLNIFDKLWIGVEGVEDIVKDVVEEYNLIAFYLYGYNCEINSKKAIYLPFVSKINNSILKIMNSYLSRRKNYSGNWERYILPLNNLERIKDIKNKNDIIVGYPLSQSIDEIIKFKSIFEG